MTVGGMLNTNSLFNASYYSIFSLEINLSCQICNGPPQGYCFKPEGHKGIMDFFFVFSGTKIRANSLRNLGDFFPNCEKKILRFKKKFVLKIVIFFL